MKCLFCGEEFTPCKFNPYQKYCSEQCAKKSYAAQHRKQTLEQSRIKKCLICGKEFTLHPNHLNQLYCSKECAAKANSSKARAKRRKLANHCYISPTKIEKPQGKTLADWCREADECNLDYGTYRGLIAQGKSFDELKAQNRPPQTHARGNTRRSFSTGEFI